MTTRAAVPELDPPAGEDELWADEDLLWTPDSDDYFGFLRTLWIALLVCCLFWFALAAGGFAVLVP